MPAPRTWCYVDTGPVIERIFAQYAGIGWIGKNTCILNRAVGIMAVSGVMLTSLELTPDLPPADRCGSCTRCLDACPTEPFLPLINSTRPGASHISPLKNAGQFRKNSAPASAGRYSAAIFVKTFARGIVKPR